MGAAGAWAGAAETGGISGLGGDSGQAAPGDRRQGRGSVWWGRALRHFLTGTVSTTAPSHTWAATVWDLVGRAVTQAVLKPVGETEQRPAGPAPY